MTKYKKHLICLVLVLLLLFSGCQKSQSGGASAPAAGQSCSDNSSEPETLPPAPSAAEKLLQNMTLQEKVYQLFILTPEALTGSQTSVSQSVAEEKLESYPVGGIIYLTANVISRQQVLSMNQAFSSASKIPLFISVDEEGGRVARLAKVPDMGTTVFGSMSTVKDTAEAYNVGKTIGSEISELGFNLDFAPVADVNSNPRNTVIGNRAFSSNPQTAAAMVSAAVKGFRDSGILCTLKHFPGHGDTAADSHYSFAETSKTLEQLRETEFVPFAAGIEAMSPVVMLGHIAAPNITGDSTPASLSKPLVDILKNELGFKGLIITDALNMRAVSDYYPPAVAAVTAINAGVDILLMPEDFNEAVNGILAAVDTGQITEERINQSVLKILSAKYEYGIIN